MNSNLKCPDCGNELEHKGGCLYLHRERGITAQNGSHHVTIRSLQDIANFLAFIMNDLSKIRVRLNKQFGLGISCQESHSACGNEANDERNGLKLCNVHAELMDELREKQ